jgi:hypothetical protein
MCVGGAGRWLGGCVVASAVLGGMSLRPIWSVVLHTSSGEMQALSSSDRGVIDGVIDALNQSIVHRG